MKYSTFRAFMKSVPDSQVDESQDDRPSFDFVRFEGTKADAQYLLDNFSQLVQEKLGNDVSIMVRKNGIVEMQGGYDYGRE